MKKIILSVVMSLSFLLGNVSLVSAEEVAVQGDLALLANGGLIASNYITGDPNTCFDGGHFNPDGANVTDLLTTSTDVVIEGDYAVVTIQPDGLPIDIVTVDITSCLPVTDELDPLACVSTVNIEEGELTIPCVEIDGKTFEVGMERRGNSDNWEVTFFGDSPLFAHHHDDEDDEPELDEEEFDEDDI